MTDAAALPDSTRIGRTALRVADLGETAAFYRDAVGLSVLDRTAATATLGTGGSPLLKLIRDPSAGPRGDRAGLFHTAFRVPSRAALGAALDRIRDGWRLDGASDHGVSEALYLTDPEDNGIEIYRDRDRDRWPRADDGSLRMWTQPLDLEAVAAASDGAADAPAETTVGHVHLEVTAVEPARGFYVDTLGLTAQAEWDSALFLAAGDYHHHVGVNVWNGRSAPAGGRGLAWVEVVVPDEATLAAARERLAAAAVPVEDVDGGVTVGDPDGIEIRLRTD